MYDKLQSYLLQNNGLVCLHSEYPNWTVCIVLTFLNKYCLNQGKRVMPETQLTRGLGFLGLHRIPIDYFLTYDIKNYYLPFVISFIFLTFYIA